MHHAPCTTRGEIGAKTIAAVVRVLCSCVTCDIGTQTYTNTHTHKHTNTNTHKHTHDHHQPNITRTTVPTMRAHCGCIFKATEDCATRVGFGFFVLCACAYTKHLTTYNLQFTIQILILNLKKFKKNKMTMTMNNVGG